MDQVVACLALEVDQVVACLALEVVQVVVQEVDQKVYSYLYINTA